MTSNIRLTYMQSARPFMTRFTRSHQKGIKPGADGGKLSRSNGQDDNYKLVNVHEHPKPSQRPK